MDQTGPTRIPLNLVFKRVTPLLGKLEFKEVNEDSPLPKEVWIGIWRKLPMRPILNVASSSKFHYMQFANNWWSFMLTPAALKRISSDDQADQGVSSDSQADQSISSPNDRATHLFFSDIWSRMPRYLACDHFGREELKVVWRITEPDVIKGMCNEELTERIDRLLKKHPFGPFSKALKDEWVNGCVMSGRILPEALLELTEAGYEAICDPGVQQWLEQGDHWKHISSIIGLEHANLIRTPEVRQEISQGKSRFVFLPYSDTYAIVSNARQ